MQSPHPSSSSPQVPIARHLLRKDLRQIPLVKKHGRIGCSHITLSSFFFFLLVAVASDRAFSGAGNATGTRKYIFPLSRSAFGGSVMTFGASTPPNNAESGGFRRTLLRERLHDVTCGNRAADLLHAAAHVHDPNHVERAAWEDAGDAAPDGVPRDHLSVYSPRPFLLDCPITPSTIQCSRKQRKEARKERNGCERGNPFHGFIVGRMSFVTVLLHSSVSASPG